MKSLLTLATSLWVLTAYTTAQDQVRISFDEPLPSGVSVDLSGGPWRIDSGHPNPLAQGAHLYVEQACNSDITGNMWFYGIDFTGMCRLRFDLPAVIDLASLHHQVRPDLPSW